MKFLKTASRIVFCWLVYILPNKLSLNRHFVFEIIISQFWLQGDSVNPCLTLNALLRTNKFCSRCPTWNSIYTRIWAHLHGVKNSRQMWLSVPYSECPTPSVCSAAQDALLSIATLQAQGPGNESICLSGQNNLATIFVMKTGRKQKILWSQEIDRPWTDKTEQYASKEECIK